MKDRLNKALEASMQRMRIAHGSALRAQAKYNACKDEVEMLLELLRKAKQDDAN